jgi:hypothetical protein
LIRYWLAERMKTRRQTTMVSKVGVLFDCDSIS